MLLEILGLGVLLYALKGIDFVGLGPNGFVASHPGLFMGLSLLDSAVISLAVARSRWSGWRLIAAIFLLYYALSSFLVAIEAFYLGDLLTPDLAGRVLLNGAVVAVILAVLAVIAHRRMGESWGSARPYGRRGRPWWSWMWRLPLAGISYMILSVLVGLCVFRPLAEVLEPGPASLYLAEFEQVNPLTILGFQAARGMLWGILTLPLLAGMKGPHRADALSIGLCYALVMAPLNLMPNSLAIGIRLAHTVEVFVGNLLFGLVVVWLLGPSIRAHTSLGSRPRRSKALA
jgi:hypothetical protein